MKLPKLIKTTHLEHRLPHNQRWEALDEIVLKKVFGPLELSARICPPFGLRAPWVLGSFGFWLLGLRALGSLGFGLRTTRASASTGGRWTPWAY